MSFKVNWPAFSQDFIQKAKEQLTVALNSGKKPENIAGEIRVTQLHMGTRPPELEIIEISELITERFKGMFKLSYTGDAFIVVQTVIQANPLHTKTYKRTIDVSMGMLSAHKPFLVPMEMKIQRVVLKGIIVLAVDKEKGITLVFKSDPLESVLVSSTFDDIPNIKKLLQRQIEAQLRKMFQLELPQMIHNLSLVMLKEQKDAESPRDEPVKTPHQRTLSNETGFIPHHRKWANNEPVYSNMDESTLETDFVLHKSLDVSSDYERGLYPILTDCSSPPSLVTRTDITSPSRYPFVGLPQQKFLSLEHLQDRDFSVPYASHVDTYLNSIPFDKLSVYSYEDDMTSVSRRMIHKGQSDKVEWHRPLETPLKTNESSQVGIPSLEITDKVVLERGDNSNTAHLANLMTSYLTISPNLRQLDNLVVRGTLSDLGKKVEKGKGRRRVHSIRVPEEVMRSMGSLRGAGSSKYSRSVVSE